MVLCHYVLLRWRQPSTCGCQATKQYNALQYSPVQFWQAVSLQVVTELMMVFYHCMCSICIHSTMMLRVAHCNYNHLQPMSIILYTVVCRQRTIILCECSWQIVSPQEIDAYSIADCTLCLYRWHTASITCHIVLETFPLRLFSPVDSQSPGVNRLDAYFITDCKLLTQLTRQSTTLQSVSVVGIVSRY